MFCFLVWICCYLKRCYLDVANHHQTHVECYKKLNMQFKFDGNVVNIWCRKESLQEFFHGSNVVHKCDLIAKNQFTAPHLYLHGIWLVSKTFRQIYSWKRLLNLANCLFLFLVENFINECNVRNRYQFVCGPFREKNQLDIELHFSCLDITRHSLDNHCIAQIANGWIVVCVTKGKETECHANSSWKWVFHSAFSIYRGHISLQNSQKTFHISFGREKWPGFFVNSKFNVCYVMINVLYRVVLKSTQPFMEFT